VSRADSGRMAGGVILSMWAGGLLLVGYGWCWPPLAAVSTVRRDIT
jgi:hypothetical protein